MKVRLMLASLAAAALLVPVAPASAQGRTDQNHFRCCVVSQQTPQPPETVTQEDQFTTAPVSVQVGEPVMICAPAASARSGRLALVKAT